MLALCCAMSLTFVQHYINIGPVSHICHVNIVNNVYKREEFWLYTLNLLFLFNILFVVKISVTRMFSGSAQIHRQLAVNYSKLFKTKRPIGLNFSDVGET